jgi:hypothetical protein
VSDIVPFPGGRSSGSGGPDDPTLGQRVARLQEHLKEVKSTLQSMDVGLGAIEVALAEMKGRLAGIEGRLQQMPTIWQTVSIPAVLLFGLAGIVFAASDFLKP